MFWWNYSSPFIILLAIKLIENKTVQLEGEQTDTPTMLIGTRQIERKHPWLERSRGVQLALNTFIELIVNLKPFVIFPH